MKRRKRKAVFTTRAFNHLQKQAVVNEISLESSKNPLKVIHFLVTMDLGCCKLGIIDSSFKQMLINYVLLLKHDGYTSKKIMYVINKAIKDIDFGAEEVARVWKRVQF